MSTFDVKQSAPNSLRYESLNIQIRFDRLSDSTGRITWNIPTPSAGCTAETQAYCGMLVAISSDPSKTGIFPADGTSYVADPTADPDLFAGDTIEHLRVVGFFPHDRSTTSLDIGGLTPNTPYFVTGFPMDCQLRYFKEGVHAYSQQYSNRGTDPTSGTQTVILNDNRDPSGVSLSDTTGLVCGVMYDFSIQLGVIPKPRSPVDPRIDCVPQPPTYDITVDGCAATTYGDLISAINTQFGMASASTVGPLAPNTGSLYFNSTTNVLLMWDGDGYVNVPFINSTSSPSIAPPGSYWLTNGALKFRTSTEWIDVTYIVSTSNPLTPQVGGIWFDGATVQTWNGTVWCQHPTLVSPTNPHTSSAPVPGDYWFNQDEMVLFVWTDVSGWVTTSSTISTSSPTDPATDSAWVVRGGPILRYQSGQWVEQTNVYIGESAPTTPIPGKLWYNPITLQLFERNTLNTDWDVLTAVVSDRTPTDQPASCELWTDTNDNVVWAYDVTTGLWVIANSTFSASDPALNVIAVGTFWFDGNILSRWDGDCWVAIDNYVQWPTRPDSLALDSMWYNPTTNVWKRNTLNGWVRTIPLESIDDPTALPLGTYWYNPSSKALTSWNGVAWVTVTYSSNPLTPTKGYAWFNTDVNKLLAWNGSFWEVTTPIALVELNCGGSLIFTHTERGSLSFVNITDGNLFRSLDVSHTFTDPKPGTDGASDTPSYEEIDIGTDGNIAIREALANEIRYELGYPVVNVELTNEQLDSAISKALMVFRERSGMAYRKGFFFMRLQANTQNYYLTNKVQGMHRIVSVIGVYRISSAFLSTAHGAGVYGQVVLQHLYNMGTFDLLSYHLMAEYTSLMEQLFSLRLTFSWNEQTRLLTIYQKMPYTEPMVTIEAAVERSEQDLMTDRYARGWLRKYVMGTCKLMLAEIRGKFSTLPGAGGNVTLNASELRASGEALIAECMADIADHVSDAPEEYGMGAHFLFG